MHVAAVVVTVQTCKELLFGTANAPQSLRIHWIPPAHWAVALHRYVGWDVLVCTKPLLHVDVHTSPKNVLGQTFVCEFAGREALRDPQSTRVHVSDPFHWPLSKQVKELKLER